MKQQIKYSIELVKALEIKPNAKYLLIFPEPKEKDKGSLQQLNTALQELFQSQVVAIFVHDVNEVKIAELVKEDK